MTSSTARTKHPPQSLESQVRAISFDGLNVTRATDTSDWTTVESLRRRAYEQHANRSINETSWISDADTSKYCEVLICSSAEHGPIGTIRVQYEEEQRVELDAFVNYRKYLQPSQIPVAQIGRLTVINGNRSKDAANALLKASWLRLLRNNIPTGVIAAPTWMMPMYAGVMKCIDFGPDTTFMSSFGTPGLHRAMWLPSDIRQHWTGVNGERSPLYHLWLEANHPNLEI